ncbi:MAG: tetratricopeptide repeat protein [Bacteroidota bacterium]
MADRRPLPALAAPAALVLIALAAGCAGSRGTSTGPALPGDAPALIALADTAMAAGDANGARRILDRALATAPESAPVHLARGRFFTAIRRYKDAKDELDRAASLDPRSAEPAYLLGIAYLASGDKDHARAAFAHAAALDPGHVRARDALASLLEGRYEAAGIPGDYAKIAARTTVSRAEVGVILAVELGVDPDRTTWRVDDIQRVNWPELDQAWGARWLRAAVMRHWIEAFPDGSLHLDDLMTRGQLALLLARLGSDQGRCCARPDSSFTDMGERHYLGRAAAEAVHLGLPLRSGRFEPLAAATGDEALRSVRGLARLLGATPVVDGELTSG